MPATADSLRDLHLLHQRATALRDRLSSGPKTLAARESMLANRLAALETARKTIKDGKAHQKGREVQVQSLQVKTEDLRAKLNTIKKQVEYDAIRNQIAHDNLAISRLEDEILESMTKHDEMAAALAAQEAEAKKLANDVAALKLDIESKAESQRVQLKELEDAIIEAEEIIPIEQRDQYRRLVKQHGADALASAENNSCSGCFVSVTTQMLNELINRHRMVFCQACGRVLYLAEENHAHARRK